MCAPPFSIGAPRFLELGAPRRAGFPIYYSYVAPPRDADNFLIAETTGKWYILYYVLTWQRWLIADARKGAAHGGLNFTGDTLEELTRALHEDYEDIYTHTWHFQVRLPSMSERYLRSIINLTR